MEYTEHEKLKLVADQSQKCGEFIEWLATKDMCLGRWPINSDRLMPASYDINALLAEFFEIDQVKLEAEKQHMLANLGG